MSLPYSSNTTFAILFHVWLMFILGCANVVTPTGGIKDTTPPMAIGYYPDSAATNFESNEIRIQFNEYIQLNDVFNQVIISPPLASALKYKLKGKTLTITISDTLKTNTTYTMNFGQAIKDLTEGNTLDNFTYVFSTGAVVDSLEMRGKVKDAITTKPLEKIFVVVYPQPNDSAFTTTQPYYFARTDKNGEWVIRNMRADDYAVYALEDMNFNYFYDLPNERIGFLDSLIHVKQNVQNIQLTLFSEDKQSPQLQEIKSPRYGLTRMAFSKPVTDAQITYTGSDRTPYYIYQNPTKDTLYFWQTNYALDSHQLHIEFDTTILDRTIAVKTLHKDSVFANQKNTFKANAFALSKAPGARADWDPAREIILNFNNPISVMQDTPYIYMDSVLVGNTTCEIDPLDPRIVRVYYPFIADKSYDLFIPKNSFIDIFGLSHEGDTILLKTRKEDAYATLTIKPFNTVNKPLLLSLTKFDGTIIKEWPIQALDTTTNITVKYLTPGVYKLQVVIDADHNRKFTTGNLAEKKQPERILFYPNDQNLRANWENEVEWKIE